MHKCAHKNLVHPHSHTFTALTCTLHFSPLTAVCYYSDILNKRWAPTSSSALTRHSVILTRVKKLTSSSDKTLTRIHNKFELKWKGSNMRIIPKLQYAVLLILPPQQQWNFFWKMRTSKKDWRWRLKNCRKMSPLKKIWWLTPIHYEKKIRVPSSVWIFFVFNHNGGGGATACQLTKKQAIYVYRMKDRKSLGIFWSFICFKNKI